MTVPPIKLPIVTGMRLLTRKFHQVSSGKSAGALPMEVQKEVGAPVLIKRPIGMKYALAMQCSKPAAAKAVIGGMIVKTRSTVVRAAKHIQTVRQTSALHMIPRVNAGINASYAFAFAVVNAVSP